MRTYARKIDRRVFIILWVSTIAVWSSRAQEAQNPPAPSTVSTQLPPAPVASAPTSQTIPQGNAGDASSAAGTGLDYMYNKKPTDGSVGSQVVDMNSVATARAAAADALNYGKLADPAVRDVFSNYLDSSEIPAATLLSYNSELQEVSNLLAANQTFDAWKRLFILAQYDAIDAGVSRELANRIESIWNIGQATNNLGQTNQQLRQDINASNRNGDIISEKVREQDMLYDRQARQGARNGQQTGPAASPGMGIPTPNSNGGGSSVPSNVSVSGLEGRLELTQEYLDALEARAQIKMNQLKSEKLLNDSERDFAAYIKTLFTTGRYQQVVLASNFYREIFNEDDYPVEIADEVNASLEKARDVANAVDVYKYDVSRNQIVDATARLQEAYSESALNPAVLGLERSLKQKSADYLSRLDKMENLIEARDFGPLDSMIQDTSRSAVDFDGTKAQALANAVKLESKLDLGKAKLAAQAGDLKDAMEEFEAAAKTWPGNPALEDSSTQFFQTEDVKNQSVTEFDRLVAEKNYREIFEKQLAFAPAIHGDANRESQLADALRKIQSAEGASEKANEMRNAGDVCGAWETLELAAHDLPGDNKLNELRAELAGKAAEFVAAVNNAEDAETRSDFGYSLSWYAVAQHYYPASSIANDGITRLSKSILSPKGG